MRAGRREPPGASGRPVVSNVVTAPTLPEGVDEHITAFVACRRDTVELAAGPVRWLPLPPGVPRFLGRPKARFTADGPLIRANVKWGLASIGVRARIDEQGLLSAETAGFAFGLEGAIQRWVDGLNEQLRRNGRRLDRLALVGDNVVITKRVLDGEVDRG